MTNQLINQAIVEGYVVSESVTPNYRVAELLQNEREGLNIGTFALHIFLNFPHLRLRMKPLDL